MSKEIFAFVQKANEIMPSEEYDIQLDEELVLVGVVYNPAGAIDVEYTATVRTSDDLIYWKVDYYHDDTVVVNRYVQDGDVELKKEETE